MLSIPWMIIQALFKHQEENNDVKGTATIELRQVLKRSHKPRFLLNASTFIQDRRNHTTHRKIYVYTYRFHFISYLSDFTQHLHLITNLIILRRKEKFKEIYIILYISGGNKFTKQKILINRLRSATILLLYVLLTKLSK